VNEQWSTYGDARRAAIACAEQILASLESALATQDIATLAVSGGTTPALMFAELAARPFDWSRVHLFWADERAVAADSPDSNYRMTNEALLHPAHFPSRNVHRVVGELEPAKAAKRYAEEIREVFNLEEQQLPIFDVIHLGMGPDGHTASLFPGDPLINDRDGIAAAVVAPKPPPNRITLLPGVLLSARTTLFLVAGADKAETIRQVIEEPLDALARPAQSIARQARRVRWFLDAAASKLLPTRATVN
jgi:6-phosphogluconolactonase